MTLPNPNVNWSNGSGGVDPYKPKDEPRIYYVVRGRGTFPLDMLRYDRSWAITDLGDPNDFGQKRRSVVCCTGAPSGTPTVDRWASFSWEVTSVPNPTIQSAILTGDVRPEALLPGDPPGDPPDRPFTLFLGTCQRCGHKSNNATMSRFNTDMVCPDCEREEKAHEDYDLACQIELDSVRIGNLNYPGIGWPRPQDATNKADIFRK